MRARPFARRAAAPLPHWLEDRYHRPRARRPVPPALFGGARARGGAAASADSYIRLRGLGDDSGLSLPYGPARNYGSPQVEAWRDLVTSLAGDIPVEFLLAWIAYESAGDPCSWTSYREAGIFQLMDGDNINVAGTTMAMQHPVPPCGANSGRPAGSFAQLPDDVATEQVRGGIQYVNWCRAYVHQKMDALGYNWSESSADFWMLVKMVHNLPSAVGKMLQAGIDANGGPVDNWEDLKKYALAAGAVSSANTHNAETVGQYGEGGGSMLNSLPGGSAGLVMIAAAGIGVWYLLKRSKRR